MVIPNYTEATILEYLKTPLKLTFEEGDDENRDNQPFLEDLVFRNFATHVLSNIPRANAYEFVSPKITLNDLI